MLFLQTRLEYQIPAGLFFLDNLFSGAILPTKKVLQKNNPKNLMEMKNKKSLNNKGVDSASLARNVLNKASTYSSDRPLFKLIGLMPFIDIPTNKEYFVGEVKFKYGSVVKIWVSPAPALFWRFEVFVAESKKQLNISTGSGTLNDFWNAVKLIAECMFDVYPDKIK
jgi:hypothetical protein